MRRRRDQAELGSNMKTEFQTKRVIEARLEKTFAPGTAAWRSLAPMPINETDGSTQRTRKGSYRELSTRVESHAAPARQISAASLVTAVACLIDVAAIIYFLCQYL